MFGQLGTGEVVSVIAESAREESRIIGRRMAAVAELLGRRTAEAEAEDPDCGYMIITGLHRTSAEVAAVMNLSPRAASILVSHAEALDSRLPKVAALLTQGRVDWRTVQLILAAPNRSPVAPSAQRWTARWLSASRTGGPGRGGGSSTPWTPWWQPSIATPCANVRAPKTDATSTSSRWAMALPGSTASWPPRPR